MSPVNQASLDLTTWTLGNSAVEDERLIYVDAHDTAQKLTKGEVITLVRLLVGGFRHENSNQFLDGKTVCVHSFNSILYPVLFHGVIAAGGCFTGTNPAYTTEELARHFRVSNTKFILAEVGRLDRIVAAAILCGIPQSHIFTLHRSDQEPVLSHRSWVELLQHGQSNWGEISNKETLSRTPAALLSTSGTSGFPKVAVRSHRSLIEECTSIHDAVAKPYVENRLVCVPLFHAFASPLANISALRYGVETFIMPKFEEKHFLKIIRNFNITETAVVPLILNGLLSQSVEARRKHFEPLRLIWCAGAPLSRELQKRMIRDLLSQDARIVQVYGLTECGWVSTFKHPERDETGSVGRLLPGCQAKLVDDCGVELQRPCAKGELLLKSPSMMLAYLENPSATTAAFDAEGWYRTGDIARIESEKIYIVDRKKDLIKVRGWQVGPAELESVLLKHEHIADAAVIGVKLRGEDSYEIPEAHVVCKTGIELNVQEVKNFMLQYLAQYKVSDCRIIVRESIPKSASGKILKRHLREERYSRRFFRPTWQLKRTHLWLLIGVGTLVFSVRTILIGHHHILRT